MKNTFNTTKVFYTILLVAALIILVPAISYVSIALGFWTNPPCTPTGSSGDCSGAIFVDNTTQNVGVKATTASTTLTVNGEISVNGNRVRNVATPFNGDDAVNLDYLLASGSNGGGGSLVLFYQTVTGTPTIAPTCPSGYTAQSGFDPGYGPHYLGIFAHDWAQSGTAGSGGFAPGFTPPTPNGSNGYSYILRSVAIGSDSVCSQSQTSIVNFTDIYNNNFQNSYAGMSADACFTSPTTGVITCNRCIVCQK